MKTTNAAGFPKRGASIIQRLSRAVLVLAASLLATQRGEAQSLLWATSYCGIPASALEEVEGVVVDSSGNVYATGLSGTKEIGSVIRTLKLDPTGRILWNVTCNQPSLCGGMWGRSPIALDETGNVIVVGAELTPNLDNWNPVLLKLSAEDGTVLSKCVFNLGPFASFDAVAVAGTDLFVVGHNNPNNGYPHVVHTLRITGGSQISWKDSLSPGTFWGTRGGIIVAGERVFTAAGGKLVARGLGGGILWQKETAMPNGGSALAEGPYGHIYLAVQNGVGEFDPSNVDASWAIERTTNQVSDLKLDADGNIYVVGSTLARGGRGADISMQKYAADGNLVWSATYGKSGGYSDDGIGLAISDGFIYVGGSKYNKNLDMCVLKYTGGK